MVGDFLSAYLEEHPKTARVDRLEGHAGGRGPRGRPPGQGPDPRAQGGHERRRPARQTPRLHQPRGREVRALPGRGRFGRRQRRGRPHPPIPGHPPAPRQDHQRLQVARRQSPGQRRGPQHDLGHRGGLRRRNGPGQTPLQQGHHHDRRRRRRLAHPHAAADLLLPPDVRPGEGRLRLRRPAAAVPRAAEKEPTTSRPKRK